MRVSVTVEVPLVTDREKGKDVGGQKKKIGLKGLWQRFHTQPEAR